ncbi:hypothetical protein KFL_005410060 [Klebsormidium nitens]|uniref:Uncharacterized protein n=1 Tax=Klebsormidium nitens TaxID=105231 RepID=A0A1Y1ILG4_KLENI|nr:hypothetical protein KFL_005410060 [Klebsormidium nitens]|eukprot:GAQ89606.1 hypothetical protein KFL_005410060 [Klebsormidium nitens]
MTLPALPRFAGPASESASARNLVLPDENIRALWERRKQSAQLRIDVGGAFERSPPGKSVGPCADRGEP